MSYDRSSWIVFLSPTLNCLYIVSHNLCNGRVEGGAFLGCCSTTIKMWRCFQCWCAFVVTGISTDHLHNARILFLRLLCPSWGPHCIGGEGSPTWLHLPFHPLSCPSPGLFQRCHTCFCIRTISRASWSYLANLPVIMLSIPELWASRQTDKATDFLSVTVCESSCLWSVRIAWSISWSDGLEGVQTRLQFQVVFATVGLGFYGT